MLLVHKNIMKLNVKADVRSECHPELDVHEAKNHIKHSSLFYVQTYKYTYRVHKFITRTVVKHKA